MKERFSTKVGIIGVITAMSAPFLIIFFNVPVEEAIKVFGIGIFLLVIGLMKLKATYTNVQSSNEDKI